MYVCLVRVVRYPLTLLCDTTESWNPAWGARSVILGLHSFMSDEADPVTYGGIDAKRYGFTQQALNQSRVAKAKASLAWNKEHSIYKDYFQGYMDGPAPWENKQEQDEDEDEDKKAGADEDKKRNTVVDLTGEDDVDVQQPKSKKRQRKA